MREQTISKRMVWYIERREDMTVQGGGNKNHKNEEENAVEVDENATVGILACTKRRDEQATASSSKQATREEEEEPTATTYMGAKQNEDESTPSRSAPTLASANTAATSDATSTSRSSSNMCQPGAFRVHEFEAPSSAESSDGSQKQEDASVARGGGGSKHGKSVSCGRRC
jgi:hypothetical protein